MEKKHLLAKFIRMSNRCVFVCLFSCLILMVVGCGIINVVYFESSYSGKVVDSETLKPIEGAVVLGVWRKEYPTVAGPVSKYYDSVELLTDANGEFSIKGKAPRAMTFLEKMDMIIFKAGYEHIWAEWGALKTATRYSERVKWEGDVAIIPLSKWSLKKRINRLGPSASGVPFEKQPLLMEEKRRERNEIK